MRLKKGVQQLKILKIYLEKMEIFKKILKFMKEKGLAAKNMDVKV